MRFRLALAVALSWSAAAVQAQVTGRITGSVLDPANAAVGDAKIRLTLAGGTLSLAETVSNAQGLFTIESIRPETYDLTVEAQGFKQYKLANVKVDPARATDLPAVKLELATTTTTVEVTADAEQVQVTTNDISTTVTIDQIRRLPIDDRSLVSFIQTQTGVSASPAVTTTINGGRSSFSTMTLDGVNIQDNYIRDNALDFSPNLPLINEAQEFTVTTSNGDAKSGAPSSVVISTRAGTNQYHGEAYWQNRNSSLAANSWFNNKDGVPLPRLNLNQFGVSFGGPLRRDRLFFYADYGMYRRHEDATVNQTILTADARQGIFTYFDTRTGAVQKRNILPIVAVRPDSVMAADLAKVPGPEKINNFRVGDSSAGLLRNTAGYSFLARNDWYRDNVTGRLDYAVSPKNQLSGTFKWNRQFAYRPNAGIAYDPLPPVRNDQATKFAAASWRWNPTATFTNELRGGFNFAPGYFINTEQFPDYFIGGTLYSPTLTQYQPQGRETRTHNLNDNATWIKGRHTIQFGYQMQGVWVKTFESFNTTPTYNVGIDSLSNERDFLFQSDLPGVSAADLDRANLLIATLGGVLDNANQTYNVTSRTSGFVAKAPYLRHFTSPSHAFYANDVWRAHRRLSVNVGMRWDYIAPVNERDALELSPILYGGDARTTMLSNSTLYFTGNAVQRPFYRKDLNNFGPNVGLAWDVFGTGKTSLRAGYGVYYANDQNLLVAETFTYTNEGLQGVNAKFNLLGYMATNRPSLPAPQYKIPKAFSEVYETNPAAYFGMLDPKLRTPYVQEFNFSIQHEFKKTIIEARYIGNHATKLLRGFDYNQTDIRSNGFLDDFIRAKNNGDLSRASALQAFDPRYNPSIPGSQPLTVFPRLELGGLLTNATVRTLIDQQQVAELAAIYQVNGLNGSVDFFPNPYALSSLYVTNYSNTNYHSLQFEVRRRFQQGLEFQGSYVFSKALGDTSGQNQVRFEPFLDINNPQIGKSRLPVDLTHQFKVNYVYELPFGRGHAIQSRNNVLNRLLEGWSTGGIVYWQSGNPFSIYSGRGTFLRAGFSGVNGANTIYDKDALESIVKLRMTDDGPYFVPKSALFTDGRGVAPDGQSPFTGQIFFNPSAGTVGAMQKRMFTGPSIFVMDASVRKVVRFRERYSAELGLDALNVFNHPTFAIFSSTINSTQFGRVASTATSPRKLQLRLQLSF